jgi:hypothetical protein
MVCAFFNGGWAKLWEWVEFFGCRTVAAARVRVFLPSGTRRARRKDRSESANGKGRIEDQKTRTFENHKGAAPKVQDHSKAGAPGKKMNISIYDAL